MIRIRSRQHGFTLLEIIIVAAILAMVVGVIYRIYTTGWMFFESQKKKAEILHDIRRVLLFFDRDLREAQLGISGRIFNLTTNRIEFERLTSDYQSQAIEKVVYSFVQSGETVKLVREPAVFKSSGKTVLMQTKKTSTAEGDVIPVGLITHSKIGLATVRTEFRGYDKGYNPLTVDALATPQEREKYRQDHITYITAHIHYIEARLVVRDKNQTVNLFTTMICPRTRMQ